MQEGEGWAVQQQHSAAAMRSCCSRSSIKPQPRSSPSILQTFALRKAARSSVSIDVDITTNRHLGTGKN